MARGGAVRDRQLGQVLVLALGRVHPPATRHPHAGTYGTPRSYADPSRVVNGAPARMPGRAAAVVASPGSRKEAEAGAWPMSGSTPMEGSAGDRSPSRPWRGWRARAGLPRGRWSWRDGLAGWTAAEAVPGLLPASEAAAAPPPCRPRRGGPRPPAAASSAASARRSAPSPTCRPCPACRVGRILVGGLQSGHAHGGHRGGADRRDAGDDPDPAQIPGGWPTPRIFWRILGGALADVLPPLPGYRAVRQLQLPPRAHRDRLVRRPLLGGRALLRAQHSAQRLRLPGGEDAAPRGAP